MSLARHLAVLDTSWLTHTMCVGIGDKFFVIFSSSHIDKAFLLSLNGQKTTLLVIMFNTKDLTKHFTGSILYDT